jgi:uncharacterized protein
MKTVTEFPFEIIEHADLGIVMPDGCRLSARIWMPKNSENQPVPAILEYLPYRKRDGTTARDCLTHPYFAGHGYACLRVDMRGNGDSEGIMTDEYTPQELQDACDVIAWIVKQPWCSGKVGMMGISWGGFNALQVAALQPTGLDAIITLCSTDDRYADDIHYKGGCLLNENLGWGATMFSYSSRPPDPLVVGENWRDMWLERLDKMPFLPAIWLDHQTRDDYWQHGSVCEDFSNVKAATLAIGGWGDAYKNAVSRLVKGIKAPVKGIIGPWIHKYPHFAVPHPQIGFLQEALRWWDRWLKGTPTGVESDPAMRIYIMDSVPPKEWHDERPGRWAGFKDWPSPEISDRKFALSGNGQLVEQYCVKPLNIIVKSPANCGAASGEYCAIWLGPEMPGEQAADDLISACFDSSPLEVPIEIVGAPVVKLRLKSTATKTQIAVRLCDIRPDGSSARVTYGVLNLCHRNSHERPELITPDALIEIMLQLDDIAYRVPEGHRLRVAVSTAYWPLVWPSPEPVWVELLRGELILPVLSGSHASSDSFEEPEGAAQWQRHILRQPCNSRETLTDSVTGETVLTITDDFGEVEDLAHGLCTGSIASEEWRVHADDPLSATGRTHWSQTLRRGDWNIRTEASASMSSTDLTFELRARLDAFEGAERVFERDYAYSIPRRFL